MQTRPLVRAYSLEASLLHAKCIRAFNVTMCTRSFEVHFTSASSLYLWQAFVWHRDTLRQKAEDDAERHVGHAQPLLLPND